MKNINKIFEEYKEIGEILKAECIKFINAKLNNEKDKSIEFDKEMNEYVSVVYDGGKHPEYDSNAFSEVYRIYINPKGITMVDTEDADIALSTLSINEIYDICETIDIHYRICNNK